MVDAWADRTAALGAVDGIEYVFCFENHGEEIGVTLSHPHGQIYGYPFLPPRVATVLAAARWPYEVQLWMGAFTSDTNPEDVAEQLRAVVVE